MSGYREDCFGPFFEHYPRMVGKGVVRARDFVGRRVCFSAIGWAATISDTHIGDSYHAPSVCTPTPLLARYAAYVAERWGLGSVVPRAHRTVVTCRAAAGAGPPRGAGRGFDEGSVLPAAPAPAHSDALPVGEAVLQGGPQRSAFMRAVRREPSVVVPLPHAADSSEGTSVTNMCRPYVRVAYVVRHLVPPPTPILPMVVGVMRVVANGDALLHALRTAGAGAVDVDVVEADFASMPYAEQVALVRGVHVLVGMHGAGMMHGVHLAPADECGARPVVVELFPRGVTQWGVRNLATQVRAIACACPRALKPCVQWRILP